MVAKPLDVDLYIATRVADKPDLEAIDSYLKAGANCNGPRGCANSPLCHASCHGHEELVKLLIRHGAKVNSIDGSQGRTPLMEASRNGHTSVVELLLKEGASIDQYTGPQGRTALIWACMEGHVSVVTVLLRNGAKKRAEALWWASRYGNASVVELLVCQLENDRDRPSTEEDDCNTNKWHPLLVASALGHANVVKLLLEQKIWKTNAALMAASERGHHSVVKLLLAEENPDKDEITAALQKACKAGHIKVVYALMQTNVASSDIICAINDGCETAMSITMQQGHLEVQRYLRKMKLLENR